MASGDVRHWEYLPVGTRVLNLEDGESGRVLNGYAKDPVHGWVEYEVSTAYGIERWPREQFMLLSELQQERS